MIPVELLGTGSLLPPRILDNAEIAATLDPPLDPAGIEPRTGIAHRHWVEPGTRSVTLGTEVLRRALASAGLEASDLRRIMFASAAGGDQISPANANYIADALGLARTCDCFDVNNACTAFLTAMDIGARSVATGLGPVGIVIVEINSDIIDLADPRTSLIFGDAAAAVILGPGDPDAGVLGSYLANDPSRGKTIFMDHPRWSGKLCKVEFGTSNRTITAGALDLLMDATNRTLAQAEVAIEDVEWVLPHQPNGKLYEAIVDALGVDRDKTYKVVHRIGSTGAAAVPFSLDQLLKHRDVKPGDRVLMLSIGGGVGYGATVLRLGSGVPVG